MLKMFLFGASLFAAAAPAFADEGHGHAMHGTMSASTPFGQPADPATAGRVVAVTMTDMSFSPAALTLKAGETVRFQITNVSGIDHDFTLGDAATQIAHRREMTQAADHGGGGHGHGGMVNAVAVKAGETKVLGWRFTTPGRFEFDCNVPGHAEAGMIGIITVTP